MRQLPTLPQPLLEDVMLSTTSKEDKKALRQTCRLFKEALDGRLIHIKLSILKDLNEQHVEKFLRRMQHVHGVSLITLFNTNSLLKYLPDKIRHLALRGYTNFSLEQLSKLTCLTTLHLTMTGSVTGLQSISGLTSLHCYEPYGSLAHLAPTLKHLSLTVGKDENYAAILQLEQLTNLETLRLPTNIPTNFFRTHSKLPLRHMFVSCRTPLMWDSLAWQVAPTTLTSLTLRFPVQMPHTLPAMITHLQLLYTSGEVIGQAIKALPGLRSLDVIFIVEGDNDNVSYGKAFENLSQLTNLQCLGIGVIDDECNNWKHETAISTLPGVALAVKKGVRLSIFKNHVGILYDLQGIYREPDTAWSTNV